MINISRKDADIIRKILRTHVPECAVWAFGSRVTGNAEPYSDLDLAIIGNTKIERHVMVRLKEAFENSTLNYRVDIIDWQTTSDSFRNIIKAAYEPFEFMADL